MSVIPDDLVDQAVECLAEVAAIEDERVELIRFRGKPNVRRTFAESCKIVDRMTKLDVRTDENREKSLEIGRKLLKIIDFDQKDEKRR